MDFVLVPSASVSPLEAHLLSAVRVLSSSQLLRAAVKEARVRAAEFPTLDTSAYNGLVSGAALRELCLSQLSDAEQLSLVSSFHVAQLHCVLLQRFLGYGREGTALTCKVLTAANVEAHSFNVQELLQPDTLLVWTPWDNLEPFAHAHSAPIGDEEDGFPAVPQSPSSPATAEERMLATTAGGLTPSAVTPSSLGRELLSGVKRGRDEGLSATPTSQPAPTSFGVFPGKRFHRENVLETVSAAVRHNDIEAVNELIDSGLPERIAQTILPFACRQCSHLPQFTLTMSCCGAVLCSRCVPSPPTVTDIAKEERRCPICKEEPLEPPQSHPTQDDQVHRLVKELKVLYHYQLKDLAHTRHSTVGAGEGLPELSLNVPTAPGGPRHSPFSLGGVGSTPVL